MDPTETANSTVDVLVSGLRGAHALGGPKGLEDAALAIEVEREHLVDLAVTVARGAEGKVDPVAVADTVVGGAIGVVGLIPGAAPYVGILSALVAPLKLLAFEASKVSMHGTGDVAVTVDLRQT